MAVEAAKKDFPQLKSINRIAKIPVVESGVQYATGMYWKIKNSNSLFRLSLGSVEGGIQMALEKSLVAVPLLEKPLFIVDNIVCKSLDTVEQRVPAINYPPELLFNMTKDLVSARIVQPVIKRADSVKQFSVNEATKYGGIAASRLDSALDVADLYVDKYLPDANDSNDVKVEKSNEDNKAIQTIEHVNRFSRKLQRRLTKRTIEEAKALKKQGADTAQLILYLLDLLVKDPKQFLAKMKDVWNHLSQDEPENQKPPENLEQLIAMVTREMARRVVHVTNFTVETTANLPRYSMQALQIANHHISELCDYLYKTANIEGTKAIALARAANELNILQDRAGQLLNLIQVLLDNFGFKLSKSTKPMDLIPLKPIPSEENEQENCKMNKGQTPKNKNKDKKNIKNDRRNSNDEPLKNGNATSLSK